MAGILYGWFIAQCNAWSAPALQHETGWDMDAIAACVVGGVSFTGGIGKISGVTVGVLLHRTDLCATILGIDTNLQFVFSGRHYSDRCHHLTEYVRKVAGAEYGHAMLPRAISGASTNM